MIRIDPAFDGRPYGRSGWWSHLWHDTNDIRALHAFAAGVGLKRSWFQNKRGKDFPHYDVTGVMRDKALLRGARYSNLRVWLNRRKALTALTQTVG